MVCLDNSEWMRNGDYMPTRMEAQHDASNLVCGSKTQQNPESTVGIMTCAGAGVEVLCSPTDDMGRILSATANIRVGGKANFAAGLQIAQLALKHRKNKNGGQRIVMFVGSPVEAEERKLTKIAKQLKKANIAVDIISMGESDMNESKLNTFIETVNKNNNSHMVTIPAGTLPSDVLITSPIVTGDDGSGGGGGGGGGAAAFSEYGGVDPNLDPELAIALRVSMEEARAEAERKAANDSNAGGESKSEEQEAAAAEEPSSSRSSSSRRSRSRRSRSRSRSRRSRSRSRNKEQDAEDQALEAAAAAASAAGIDIDDMDDDALLQQALMMSMADEGGDAGGSTGASGSGGSTKFIDKDFMQSLLSGLPGVDMNDPQIRAAMAGAGDEQDAEGDDDDDNDGEDDDRSSRRSSKKRSSKRRSSSRKGDK
ncbi:26S proteasome non-ATPase regulatory subunit 4-like [Hondaea fermentalgiana]|uniref:26S proteasome non-ATPase regulatory subunit 4-like n=1 Tax=Hondaea fermentalgiana TaxID=2315210 RepID=A0A2R5G3W1_9STRA|nr:26S proteasome non-ATPase regulatory subunit 4-like [Hondaea fermentalgiana]|eukprot:GBG24458.1 26S proteasome non-ATPase regulatory subunit 4-like [Hondaea fermentalgiana]